MSGEILFGRVPLVAGFCLGAALLFRALVGRHDRDVRKPRVHHTRLRTLEIGLLGVCAGHAVMLAWPARVLAWNRSPDRLLAFEIVFFVFGSIALVGVLGLVAREMRDAPSGVSGSLLETMSLALLLVAVVSGLAMAVQYRWASSWSSITLTPWVRSVLRLQPDPQLVEDMPYLVRLHLFSGIALVVLLPFVRIHPVVGAWIGGMSRALAARPAAVLHRWCAPLLQQARTTWRGLSSSESDD